MGSRAVRGRQRRGEKEPSRPGTAERRYGRPAGGGAASSGRGDFAAAAALDIVPPALLEPPLERESIGSFDEDWALLLDRWLRRLSKREGLCRLVMGRLAHPLLERKSYRRLGFARVGDYARERLGISARELQSLASVATRLHALPATEAALIRGELSWSKVRLLAGTATAESEQEWIARAQAMTVRALQARITSESQAATPANSAQGAAADCDGSSIDVASGCVVGVVAGADANVAAGLVTDTGDGSAADPVSGSPLHAACDLPAAVAGGSSVDTPASTTTGAFVGNSWNEGAAGDLPAVSGTAPQAAMQAAVDTDEDHCIDGEEPAEVRIACPRYVRSAWRMAVELASRMSGTPLPQWRAAEAVAAEALAGAPAGSRACLDGSEERDTEEGTSWTAGPRARSMAAAFIVRPIGPRCQPPRVPFGPFPDPFDAIAYAEHPKVASIAQEAFPWLEWNAVSEGLPDELVLLAAGAEDLDPFALDMRIRRAQRAMQRLDFQIGRLLRTLADRRLHQAMGFRTLARYVRERLGFSSRKASMLMSIERRSWQTSTELTEALREGAITPLKAAALMPVLSEWTASAWIERARTVTLRRLTDEVGWALDKRDFEGSFLPVAPPPAGMALADLQSALRSALAEARRGGLASGDGQAINAWQTTGEWQVNGDSQMCAQSVDRLLRNDADYCEDGAACAEFDRHIIGSAQVNGDSQMCARLADRVSAEMDCAGDDRMPRPALLSPSPRRMEPIVSSEIRFRGPRSVALLFADAIAAWSRPGQAPWKGLWRVLAHVIEQWLSEPRHRDPVFERDGWRCAVPGCSSRRNLQDHHLLFRSRGGDNSRDNRIALCLWHHQHGIHDGIVSAHGRAPDDVHWKLGIRSDGRALLELHGETYVT